MKHALLFLFLLCGMLVLSQEKLKFFKSFPIVSCTGSDTNFHPGYYKCADPKTGKIGVTLLDSTVIIPLEYIDVKLVSFAHSCIDSAAYFLAENHGGTYEVFQLDGSHKILLPELHSLEPLQTLAHLYQRKAPPLLSGNHYPGEQLLHLLLDPKTGKASSDYLRIESFGNFFIGSGETGIDVIDTNLNVITSIPLKGEFDMGILDSKRFEFEGDWLRDPNYDYREQYDESFMDRLFGCAIIAYQDQPTKRQMRKGVYEIKRKQLLHLASGKISPAIYQEIYRIVSEKEVYYWALKDNSGQNEVFDVYNEQLECLRSTQITAPEKFHEFGSLSHYSDYEEYEHYAIPGHPAFHLENPQGKLAILHHNGTRLTDFIWDRKVTYEGVQRDSTPVFLFCAKDTSLFGILMDKNGKPLFEQEYASPFFIGNQKFFYSRKKYPEIKILSPYFETLIDSAEHFYYFDASVLNTDSRSPHVYIDRTNRLFILTSQGISPLYPSFFKEPKDLNRVSSLVPLFVDEKGYLIPDGKTVIRPF